MKLTKKQLEDLRLAVGIAIAGEMDLIEAHRDKYTGKPMRGYTEVIREIESRVKRFGRLRDQITDELDRIRITGGQG